MRCMICINASMCHWREGKKPMRDSVLGLYLNDSSGDATKICREFPTFLKVGGAHCYFYHIYHLPPLVSRLHQPPPLFTPHPLEHQ